MDNEPAPSPAAEPPARHIPGLDALRGGAILLVFACHSLLRLTSDGRAAALGIAGVSLFFVISGFCIHLSAAKLIERHGAGWVFVRGFLWRRFWRIYPPYLLALGAFAWMQVRHGEGSFADFAWHAALLHNWFSSSFFSINPAFWSIAVEWQFYLLYPLLALAAQRWGMVRALLGAGTLSLLARAWATLHQDWQLPLDIVWWDSPMVLLFDWLVGVWIAERWRRGQPMERLWSFTPVLLIPAVGLALFDPGKAPLGFPLYSLAFGGVLACTLAWNGRPGRMVRAVEGIGLCSYSLYLWHQPLLGYVQYHVEKLGWPSTGLGPALEYGLVVFPVLLAWSWVAYRWIERPSMAIGHRPS